MVSGAGCRTFTSDGADMAEPFFKRAQRLVSAGISSTLDRAEAASGTSIMREAVREVGRAHDRAELQRDAAERRKTEAETQQAALRKEIKDWQQKAEYALSKDRPDLAEQAIGRQIDLEREIESLGAERAAAMTDIRERTAAMDELAATRSSMQTELEAIEKRQKQSPSSATAHASAGAGSKAQQAFERSRALLERVGKLSPTPPDAAGDIEEMMRQEEIERRLAAMKTPAKGKRSKK